MRRLALVNLKGGVGKTATATSLAVGLAGRGARVLFIDADQSGNATWTLTGGTGGSGPTLADVLTRRASVSEAIRPTTTPQLHLLPADATLGGVNVALAQELGRDTRLRSALAVLEGYDVLVVDTGPSFSTILANVLVAVEEVLVPLDPSVYAVLGLVQLQETIAEVREVYGNDALRLAGLVLTRVPRTNVARDVENELRARFGDLVCKTTIPQSVDIERAHTHGQTVVEYAPKSAGALAYGNLLREYFDGGATNGSRRKVVRGPRAIDAA